ncbi:uncharacterized protein K460DRAFT_370785 [Cucurbitaria berberidis CBS 394.84]|uniref:Uncharacterized protein n=1 Tax=Cucurbitaria berberidis CBS 394.84 TaxID=1168544 RepID=A0A9P4G8E6_9PLEO|nr:uncharacterized protein K460DRAFT_370785 [Cucurbitaria berberidis CBS 394.84]KAF1840807.1 hypothetical protein K460DRAFT_370785 [Cucurbitaria berberidis CBS 394.84]
MFFSSLHFFLRYRIAFSTPSSKFNSQHLFPSTFLPKRQLNLAPLLTPTHSAIPLLLFIDTYALFQSEEGLLPGAIILFTGVCLTAVWATSRILCLEHMIMKTVEARIRILEIAARVQGREAVKTRDEEWFERKAWGGVFWDFGGV